MQQLVSKARMRANNVRGQLGLGDEPVSDIFTLIEEQGIYLFFKNLGENISAMFTKTKYAHMVIINSNKTKGHQIFSAAHELSHYLYDTEVLGGVCKANSHTQSLDIEKLADLFASHLLMPEEGLLRHVSKRTDSMEHPLELADVIFLQQYYQVSWQAMIHRLHNIRCISTLELENFKKVPITLEASRLGYRTDLYKKTQKECDQERPSRKYIELAMKNYQSREISESRLKEYLIDIGINLNDLNSMSIVDEED